jgi:hypothetical protein
VSNELREGSFPVEADEDEAAMAALDREYNRLCTMQRLERFRYYPTPSLEFEVKKESMGRLNAGMDEERREEAAGRKALEGKGAETKEGGSAEGAEEGDGEVAEVTKGVGELEV